MTKFSTKQGVYSSWLFRLRSNRFQWTPWNSFETRCYQILPKDWLPCRTDRLEEPCLGKHHSPLQQELHCLGPLHQKTKPTGPPHRTTPKDRPTGLPHRIATHYHPKGPHHRTGMPHKEDCPRRCFRMEGALTLIFWKSETSRDIKK
jgi:hypothetical protein